MKTREEQIDIILRLQTALYDEIGGFLFSQGWSKDDKDRWQKRFNGKWRHVLSTRVAFNIEVNSGLFRDDNGGLL